MDRKKYFSAHAGAIAFLFREKYPLNFDIILYFLFYFRAPLVFQCSALFAYVFTHL